MNQPIGTRFACKQRVSEDGRRRRRQNAKCRYLVLICFSLSILVFVSIMCYHEQCRPQMHIYCLYLSVTNIAFLSTRVTMKKLSMQFCYYNSFVGLATVLIFRLIDAFVFFFFSFFFFLFFFFILKSATAIELSRVISVFEIVEKKLLSSFQCQEDSWKRKLRFCAPFMFFVKVF